MQSHVRTASDTGHGTRINRASRVRADRPTDRQSGGGGQLPSRQAGRPPGAAPARRIPINRRAVTTRRPDRLDATEGSQYGQVAG